MMIELTDPKYLRRLARAINAQRYGEPMTLTMNCGEVRRIRSAKFGGRARFGRDCLQVKTIGSDMWFPATADQISGVCASRVL
jgi:hypothetical protein